MKRHPLWPEVGGLGWATAYTKVWFRCILYGFMDWGFGLDGALALSHSFSFFCFWHGRRRVCIGNAALQSAHQVRVRVRVRVRSRFALGRSNTWAGNWRWSGIDIGD